MMSTECPKHSKYFQGLKDCTYYVSRCAHLGNRAVVQVETKDSHYTTVDYVEYLDDGDVIVEATDHLRDQSGVDESWKRLCAKMLRGEPPKCF